MDKCTAEDLTVDASVCGRAREIDGKFYPVEMREPFDFSLYCNNCGAEIHYNGTFDEAVREHLATVQA